MIILRGKLRGAHKGLLEQFAARAARIAGVSGEVDVLITSSTELGRLNRQFRGKNEVTDVLSFPSADGTAGDIAISVDIAKCNARALGHSFSDELKILILHGLLHLAGYDHEVDNGQMARKEARLRRALGLPTALIERTGSPTRRLLSRSGTGKRQKR